MCLYVAAYLALMGENGLREVNEQSYAAAHYLHDRLLATGKFSEAFPGQPFLNEFTLRYDGCVCELRRRMAEAGYLAGVCTEGMEGCLTLAATETRTREEIDMFVSLI